MNNEPISLFIDYQEHISLDVNDGEPAVALSAGNSPTLIISNENVEKIILVQLNQPSTHYNKLWLKLNVETVVVPTINDVEAIELKINVTSHKIGYLSNLTTTNKTNVVSAINEINNSIVVPPSEFAGRAINDAIKKAKREGKHKVQLLPGKYFVELTIMIDDNIHLCGAGEFSTILKIKTGHNIDCIRVDHFVHEAILSDFTIDGNKKDNYSYFHQPVEHGNAINVWFHYGRIERVRTLEVYKHSLLLNYDVSKTSADGLGLAENEDDPNWNVQGNLNKVLWCNFNDSNLEGIMWGWRTMDSWFCYNNIGSNAANLYLEGGTSRFIGNHFDGDGINKRGPEYNVFCPNGCNNMMFAENVFENTQKHNVYFKRYLDPDLAETYAISFCNNIIRTASKEEYGTYPNIYIGGQSYDKMNHSIIITGNTIVNPDGHNPAKFGVNLEYCDGCSISNNSFYRMQYEAIKFLNCGTSMIDIGNCKRSTGDH